MRLENTKHTARSFVYNSLLLTLSAVIMRAVGVSFNVYISNRVGAEVMGLYSLVGNVWGFALTLGTSGINLAATRCVAEAQNSFGEMRQVMKKCVLYAFGFGSGAATLLLLLARPVSILWLKDTRAILPLQIMSISLPAIAVSSALSGYFSAVRRVWKSAAVQILEQTIKIFGTAFLLTPLLPRGIEYACVAIVLGGVTGEVLSFLFYWCMFVYEKRKFGKTLQTCSSSRKLTGKIFSIAMPIALSAYVRSGLTTVEHILIPVGLQSFGLSPAEALESYGMLSGMVLPIVLFPYALIHSFTGLLVPAISGGKASGEKRHIEYITSRVWRLTLIFGLCGAGVLAVCSSEFGWVLYNSKDVGKFILALAPLMPLMYLDTVTDSILKGLGEQIYTMNVNIADAAISVILVRFLVPQFGIHGYIAVLYTAEIINFSFSAVRLMKICKFEFKLFKWLILPTALLILTSQVCVNLFDLIPPFLATNVFSLTLHTLTVIIIYIFLLSVTGAFDKEMRGWLVSTLKLTKDRKNV